MPSVARAQRLAERIRQEIADLMLRDLVDPRFQRLSVTDVQVDREFAFADVYVSTVEAEASRREEILKALEGARGYVRHHLAARIPLRTFPQLRFRWDPTPERAERLEGLIDRLQNPGAGKRPGEKHG
ncbi:MAG: 30S ribosome-binding factor RbfA [Chloroflexi bacterium]|nr:30S ribosome-binding factor RbfA [Chloroflexota bacterium]